MDLTLVPDSISVAVDDLVFVFDRPARADFVALQEKNDEIATAYILERIVRIEGVIRLDGREIGLDEFKQLAKDDKIQSRIIAKLTTDWIRQTLLAHGFGKGAEAKKDQVAAESSSDS